MKESAFRKHSQVYVVSEIGVRAGTSTWILMANSWPSDTGLFALRRLNNF